LLLCVACVYDYYNLLNFSQRLFCEPREQFDFRIKWKEESSQATEMLTLRVNIYFYFFILLSPWAFPTSIFVDHCNYFPVAATRGRGRPRKPLLMTEEAAGETAVPAQSTRRTSERLKKVRQEKAKVGQVAEETIPPTSSEGTFPF